MDLQQMEQPYGGMAGGGLLSLTAPMAQQVQSQGRGEDSMLVHMTPNEVNSLQGLAMAHGGSLTINPETGLPEAGFLKNLLPTLLGAGLMLIPGVNALAAAGMVAGGSVLKTGSLKKGLMAGLQAYGGASLAGGLGAGNVFGAAAKQAAPALTAPVSNLAGAVAPSAPLSLAGAQAVPGAVVASGAPAGLGAVSGGLGAAAGAGAPASFAGATAQAAGQTAAKTGLSGALQKFGDAAKAGIPSGTPSFIANRAPMLAGMGLMQGVSGAVSGRPSGGSGSEATDNSYQGPYYAQERKQIRDPDGPLSSKQRRHFDVDMPEIYNTMGQVVQPGSQTKRGTQIMQPVFNPKAKKGQPMYNFMPIEYRGGVDPEEEENAGYAHGGEIQLADGAFVLDARTVSEIGNGSSSAGIEALRRLGGRPVKGKGDGVSDSVPARIGKKQPARVARDEVVISAKAVRRLGKGNPQRGAAKLYALMDKAHNARKKAGRGQDTKLSRGLG
jgi:hypothetical protein